MKQPWGLVLDIEFGGCKCADEKAEWGPNPANYSADSWGCYCVNPDLVGNQVSVTDPTSALNGVECGVVSQCQAAAVKQ